MMQIKTMSILTTPLAYLAHTSHKHLMVKQPLPKVQGQIGGS